MKLVLCGGVDDLEVIRGLCEAKGLTEVNCDQRRALRTSGDVLIELMFSTLPFLIW